MTQSVTIECVLGLTELISTVYADDGEDTEVAVGVFSPHDRVDAEALAELLCEAIGVTPFDVIYRGKKGYLGKATITIRLDKET